MWRRTARKTRVHRFLRSFGRTCQLPELRRHVLLGCLHRRANIDGLTASCRLRSLGKTCGLGKRNGLLGLLELRRFPVGSTGRNLDRLSVRLPLTWRGPRRRVRRQEISAIALSWIGNWPRRDSH